MGMIQQMFASFQTTAGAPGTTTDALFAYVSLLLNGDNGTAFNADASTNNFAVTPVATVRNDTFNPFRTDGYYSNYFNGSTDYVVPPTIATFGTSYTIEAWINTSNITSGTIFIASVANVANFAYIGLSVSSGTLSYSERATTGGANPSITGGTIVANTWYHVAVSVSSNSAKLFLNGTQVGSTTSVTAPTPTLTFTSIGAINNGIGAPVYFSGYISNVRVTNTAVYTSNFTPTTSPLTAISGTVLLTCQSSRFKDNSTNAYAITLGGTPAVKPAIPFTYVDTSGSAYMNGATSGLSSLTMAGNAAVQVTTQDFTIECWVYPQLPNLTGHDSANNFIWSDNDSSANNGGILITLNATQLVFGWYTNATSLTTASASFPAINFNAWSHIAVSRVGTTAYLCVNGVATAVSCPNPFAAVGGFPTIGQMGAYATNPGAGYREFSGYMSNFRYVKGTALYSAGTTYTVPTAPLTAITNTSLLTLQNSSPANNKGFFDSSLNKAPFVPGGNPTQGTFSPYSQTGWCTYLDGSSYLQTASGAAIGSGNFTVECWVYPTTSSGTRAIYGWRSGSTTSPYILLGTTNFPQWSADSAADIISNTAVTVNAWNHIACVRSGTTFTMYLNGLSVATATNSVNYSYASGIDIGAMNTVSWPYTGYISNIRVVVGTAVYTGAFTPPSSALAAISGTSFLACQSNRFKDNSTNNFALTATGTPKVIASSPFEPATSYSVAANGGSTYFNGTTDYIYAVNPSSAYSFGTGDFTVEFWVYPLSGPSSTYTPAFYTHNSTGGAQWNANGGFRIHHSNILFSNSGQLNYTSAITNNVWTHVALTRVGNTMTAYKNGVANGTLTHTIAVGSPLNQPALSTSDSANTGGREWLNGYMTDVRIVNGTAIYTGTFAPPTAPLLPTTYANTTLLLSNANTAVVDSAAGNDVMVLNAAQSSSIQKKFGAGAMKFNSATADYMTIPSGTTGLQFGSGNFTIEAWVYVTSVAASQVVLCGQSDNSSAAGSSFVCYVGGTSTSDFYSGSTAYSATSPSPAINTWAHVAWVRNGVNLTSYLNGTAVSTIATLSTNAINVGAATFANQIGARGNGANNPLNGYIDDLRVTKGIARYTGTFTPPTASFPTR